MTALNAKQQAFVTEYLVDHNASQAAIRAGYSWECVGAGFYAYFLIDPRTDAIFYVGKGKGNRMSSHAKEAVSGNCRNGAKGSRILAILRNGLKPVEIVFAAGLSEACAYAVERSLIDQMRHGLTNMAGGIVSRDESDMAVLDDTLARFKPFEQWFLNATEGQLKAARSLCGGATEFHAYIHSELKRHRDQLARLIAVNTEQRAA